MNISDFKTQTEILQASDMSDEFTKYAPKVVLLPLQ